MFIDISHAVMLMAVCFTDFTDSWRKAIVLVFSDHHGVFAANIFSIFTKL